jgi:hypothetical protein
MYMKEHLQFMAMLLPTLLLIAALLFSLAAAARDLSQDGASQAAMLDPVAVQQTEIGPLRTVVVQPE